MKQRPSAGTPVKQKTIVGMILAIVAALLLGAALLIPASSKPANAEDASAFSSWWIDGETVASNDGAEGSVVSVKKLNNNSATAALSCTISFAANEAHAYIAVKYSGTATLDSITLWGTKGGTPSEKEGWGAVSVAGEGWTLVSHTKGEDSSVVVGNLGAMYVESQWNIDTVTNIGFILTGDANTTFTVHDIKVSATSDDPFGGSSNDDESNCVGLMTSEISVDTQTAVYNVVNNSGDDYAVVSYTGGDPGWYKCFIDITNRGERDWLYITLTPTDNCEIMLGVGNDATILSSTVYNAGKEATIEADISGCANSFTMSVWIDANIDKASNSITFHSVEVSEKHSSGEDPDPIVPGQMTIGDINGPATYFTIEKGNDGVQTVSYDKWHGWTTLSVQVSNWDTDKNWLCIDFEPSADITMGVGVTSQWSAITKGLAPQTGGYREKITYDLSTLDDLKGASSFILYFWIDAEDEDGTTYDPAKVITFYEIGLRESDANQVDTDNTFGKPEGLPGYVVYNKATGAITYNNNNNGAGAQDVWRRLTIPLYNHTPATHDVLSLKLTGYVGLRLGVSVVYTVTDTLDDEVVTTEVSCNLLLSDAYYSEVKTAEEVEYIFYFESEFQLKDKDKKIESLVLYFDVNKDAGVPGEHTLQLGNVEMLSSAELDPTVVTVAAEEVSVQYGEQPVFDAKVMNGEEEVENAPVYTEWLDESINSYVPGLPTSIGDYNVRFYYPGSRQYKFVRTDPIGLHITKLDTTAEEGKVTFDPATRTVTVASGYEASTSESFIRGKEVTTGYQIAYGEEIKVYYRVKGDATHNASDALNVTFIAPTVTGITITSEPVKKTYAVGEELDLVGLEVTAKLSDNSTHPVTVTKDMLSGYHKNTEGVQTVTVTYEGKTATFGVMVQAKVEPPATTLSSIAVTTQPTKTTYTVGDTIDIAGLVVTATYSDETTKSVTVTMSMLSGYNMSAEGTQTVTITHEGKTATFTITVNAKQGGTPSGGNTTKPAADDGLSGGEIAIIVIAVIVCLGAVAAAIIVVLRKKKDTPKE